MPATGPLVPGGSGRSRAPSAWTVFLLSVAATLLFWAVLPPRLSENENRDYFAFYLPVAERILAGHGPTLPGGSPATRYPPGYPLFLAASFGIARSVGISAEAVRRVLTVSAVGVTAVLLHSASSRIWGRRAALSTALLWSTYPFALWLTKQPNSEVPFLVLFFGAWALFWKALLERSRSGPLYAVVGVLLGLAMLVRPIALGAGLVLGAVLWLTRSEWTRSTRLALIAILLGGNILPILPWEAWVWSRTGQIIPLSAGGLPSVLDGLTFAVDRKDFRQGVRVPADVEDLMREIRGRGGRIASAGDVVSLVWRGLRIRPVAVVKLIAIKLARSWYATNSERFEGATLAVQILYAAVILAGIAAAWWRGGPGREMAIGVLLMTSYFWAMTVSTLSLLRYMVPAMGLLFIPVSALFARANGLVPVDTPSESPRSASPAWTPNP